MPTALEVVGPPFGFFVVVALLLLTADRLLQWLRTRHAQTHNGHGRASRRGHRTATTWQLTPPAARRGISLPGTAASRPAPGAPRKPGPPLPSPIRAVVPDATGSRRASC